MSMTELKKVHSEWCNHKFNTPKAMGVQFCTCGTNLNDVNVYCSNMCRTIQCSCTKYWFLDNDGLYKNNHNPYCGTETQNYGIRCVKCGYGDNKHPAGSVIFTNITNIT